MDLKVLSDDGDVLRLALTSGIVEGALVPDTAPFERLLGRDGYARTVLMSLAQVNLIDSRCMGWLLIVHQRFREAGGKLKEAACFGSSAGARPTPGKASRTSAGSAKADIRTR